MILSNEEMAILTQGKPGSCLELILNNGEVLYAVIDSENDFDCSSSKLMQVTILSFYFKQYMLPVVF